MRNERHLLILAGIFISINQFTLILVQNRPLWSFWSVLVWGVCALTLHLTLGKRLPNHDPYLLPAMLLLVGWGLNLIARLAPPFSDRQTLWLAVSTATLLSLLKLPSDLEWLRKYHYWWLSFGLAMLGATIIWGVNPSGYGPRLWLGFGEIFYQPSELLKVLLVAFLASYLADHWLTMRQNQVHIGKITLPALSFLRPVLPMFGLCLVMLIWQQDLGTATIFFVVFMLMLYLASGHWLLLVGGTGLLGIAAIIGYMLFDIVALRIDVWWNPWDEAEGRAFQIVQSLMAVAAGGLIGQGIGQGIPTFIPVVHSDFVFSAIAEEWGLIGILGLLFTLAVIVLRGIRLATLNQDRPFFAFLAAGLSLIIGVQSLMIIGGTLRLWPLTGVTLPFVSYGGSSLLTSFLAIGLLLIISKETE